MLYYLGLSRMGRGEAIAFTAQLKVLTGVNLVGDSVRKTAAVMKSGLLKDAALLLDRQGQAECAKRVREADGKLSWDTETLSRKIQSETEKLAKLSQEQLGDELRRELQKLASLEQGSDDRSIAVGVLERAARSVGIDPVRYMDPARLEMDVFEESVQRQFRELKKRLERLSPAEREKLAAMLDQELMRLSRSEREAIRQFTGEAQLSGTAMLAILRTLSGVAMAKLVFAGAGFGAFLFLTTVMKATSLLLGVTLSFGTYAAAASTMAFLVSGPMLVLIAGLSGGFVLRRTNRQVEDQLAQLAVVSGYWRMSGSDRG